MSNAIQFFPHEDQIRCELIKICTAYKLPGENPWRELAGIFSSITFEDHQKEEGMLWCSFGCADYRLSLKLPGVATGCTPDMDLEQIATLAEVEDIFTLHWKGEKNWTETDNGVQSIDIVTGIPFPEKENNTAKLADAKSINRLLFPQKESTTLFKVEENQVTTIHLCPNGRSVCEAAIIDSTIEEDYLMEVFSPPQGLLELADTLIAVSAEGVYLEQANRRLYLAGISKDFDSYVVIPEIDPNSLIYISKAEILTKPNSNVKIIAKDGNITLTAENGNSLLLTTENVTEFNITALPGIINQVIRVLSNIDEAVDMTAYFYPNTSSFLISFETAPATYTFLINSIK